MPLFNKKMKKMDKKGVIDQLGGLIIPLVAIAIILAVGFLIFAQALTTINDIETSQTCNETERHSAACNATYQVRSAMEDIPGWLPIIIITVIGALLIGLVGLFRRR